tara:strand:- start:3628 stop:4344 length:717 start_codon:yes stop_codon:yes gene_type:complete
MLLSAHQPTYLPWLGLFHKIYVADLFIIYDDVEYSRYGWYNRNYILSKNGPILLVVPIKRNFSRNLLHNEVQINNSENWRKKHLRSIEFCYSRSPFFNKYFDQFLNIYTKKYDTLFELNISILKLLLKEFDIKTEIKFASDYNLKFKKSDRALDLAIKTKATHILFGELGENYAEINKFKSNEIKALFQKYKYPKYQHFNSKQYFTKLSSIDLLFNYGKDSKKILLSNNFTKMDYLNS